MERLDVDFQSSEVIGLKVYSMGESGIVAAFYRPPNQNVNQFNEELENFLALDLIKKEKNVILVGDFNIC